MSTLRVTEIFISVQGESTLVGLPTVFVRLTGCPLRCLYCDTAYAFSGGKPVEILDIVAQVVGYGVKNATVTGGEPLAQPDCLVLLRELVNAGIDVSLETSGAIAIDQVDPRVRRIVDIKTPGSGEVAKNLAENLNHLTANDEVKFVICDRADYDWSVEFVRKNRLNDSCSVLFSPSYEQLNPTALAQWIIADRLDARLQLQMHKYLWGNEPGR